MSGKTLGGANMLLEFPVDVFAKCWFEEWSEDPPVRGWATMVLEQLIDHSPESAWILILKLAEKAEGEDELGLVAAGPLENLIADHGPQFVDRLEQHALKGTRFKECLAMVWGRSRFEGSVYKRIQKLLGHSESSQ